MSVLLAILSTFAFCLPIDLIESSEVVARMSAGTFAEKLTAFLPIFGQRMYPHCILLFLLFWLLFYTLIKKIRKKPFSVSAFLTGGLFDFYLLVGECADKYGNLEMLILNIPQTLITVLKFIGYLALFYVVIYFGFVSLDERICAKPQSSTVSKVVLEKHSYLFPWLIILLCWLPWIFAFYPGFIPSDGLKQLNNFFGSGNFTDHHPAFSSMLMGWAMRLGRHMGSDNLGIFCFTGPQVLLTASVIASIFPLYKKMRSPLWLRWSTLAVFSLVPIWPNYAYSLLKDTLYMVMILYYVIQLAYILLDPDEYFSHPGKVSLLIFALCLAVMVRHEAKYVITFISLCLLFVKSVRKYWLKLLAVLLLPLACITVFDHVIRPAMNIPDGPLREALTVPMRQVAAVVIYDEASLTNEDISVLQDCFDYEVIASSFRLENADLLKDKFSPSADFSDIIRFLITWAEIGLKHPKLYFDIFLCCNSRYYDPLLAPYSEIYGWFGIVQESYVNKGIFDISYWSDTEFLRSVLVNIADGLPKLPLTSLFYSLGWNAWCLIFCLAYLLRKEVNGVIIPLLPGCLTFLIMQTSAINGFFRYMLPLLVTLPVCMAWIMVQKDQN